MPKKKTIYICQTCSNETPNWHGQCPSCGEWNTLVETVAAPQITPGKRSFGSGSGAVSAADLESAKPVKLSKVKKTEIQRVSSNIEEFDRVLGGGFVPGQVILLAGDPGIGKSTLLTQLAREMPNSDVLYVCGEESVNQIRLRTDRMNYSGENLLAVPETNVETVIASLEKEFAQNKSIGLVIVDSVQTIYSMELTGAPGSVGQVRESSHKLSNMAKRMGIPLILVGHVTKQGTVAGPKVLEHLVDTVLYLEGDAQHMYRMLKTTKNRFGPVSEIGVFEMEREGMVQVENPSKMFLSHRLSDASGSCVAVVMEGMRPILFEIQALVTKTSFGYPRRTASGFNVNRLNVLVAILEKRAGLNLSNHDIFINVAGGYKVSEYAADLAVCLAIFSSMKDTPLGGKVAAFGECGLSGEIRKVSYEDRRLKEAKKLGFNVIIYPDEVKSLKQALKKVF